VDVVEKETEKMKRMMMMLALAALTVVALSASAFPSFAASPQQQCEAAGGEFSRSPGEKHCTFEEEGKNPKFSKEREVSQKGSFSSSHEPVVTEECNRPGNAPQCPPGQFR
jgi:hypothetical protein